MYIVTRLCMYMYIICIYKYIVYKSIIVYATSGGDLLIVFVCLCVCKFVFAFFFLFLFIL